MVVPSSTGLVCALVGGLLAVAPATAAPRAAAEPPAYSVAVPAPAVPRAKRLYYVAPSGSERVVARVGGRSDARATLVAHPGERPVLAGRLKITARYFRVSGFAFRSNGTEEAIVWVAARNVEVSKNDIHDGTI